MQPIACYRTAAARSFLMLVVVACCVAQSTAARSVLLVAQLRSVDETFADFGYFSEAVGLGQIGQIFAMTTRQYARGLDGTRPVTVYVDGEADEYRWLAILPTADLPGFLQSLGKGMANARQLPNGIVEISGKRRFALMQSGKWTLVADSAKELTIPTVIPLQQLVSARVPAVDIAVDIFPRNLPSELRQQAFAAIREQAAKYTKGIQGNGATAILRKALTREVWDQFGQLVNDVDQLRLEWTTDSVAKRVLVQLDLQALPETLTARRLSQFQLRPSQLAGVLQPSATATCNAVGVLPPEDAPRFEHLLSLTANAAREELQNTQRFADPSTQRVAMLLVEGLIETCQLSLRDGRFDGAGLILTAQDEMQGLAGAYVANPESLRKALALIAAEPAEMRRAWQLSPNLSREPAVSIHQLVMTTPADESMRSAFGPQLTMFVAFTEHQMFLALGANGANLIQSAMQQQSSGQATSVLPFHAQVVMAPAVRFYQRVSDDPRTARMLQSVGERDRFTVRAKPINEGVRFSLEADQGVLQTIGLALVPSFGSGSKGQK